MNLHLKLALAACLALTANFINAQKNALQECWAKQVSPIGANYLEFSYHEKLNELYHSSEPWQQLNYTGSGRIWCNGSDFIKQDTLENGTRSYYSKTEFTKNELLFLDYGDKDLFAVTQDMFLEQVFKTAAYTPMQLIAYFYEKKIGLSKEKSADFFVYETTINRSVIKLYISKTSGYVEKITVLSADDLHGDILNTYSYSNYSKEKIIYPKTISIDKLNGRLKDEVKITNAWLAERAPDLLQRPEGYRIKAAEEKKSEAKIEKYNEHIHFINLMPAGVKVMLVEFRDFLFIAEAPLNSENGELIISEAKKIAPGKPIKYFAFSHHHPHYIGGMRSLVHKGITVISVKDDSDYLNYIVKAPHTLEPDSLELQPKPLNLLEIKDSLLITDGAYSLKLYYIGEKSEHTKDYTILYFPEEKMVYEGDLLWIDKSGEAKKAGKRQAGFYNAIKDLHLDVRTIIQSWGFEFNAYKVEIPFEDLEKSMQVK